MSHTSSFTAYTLQVNPEQMEAIRSAFDYSSHPLNSKEIIIEVSEDQEDELKAIVPDADLSGLIICHC